MYDLNIFAGLAVSWALDYSDVLLFALIALNVVDVLLTLDVLLIDGHEINPIARLFMRVFGQAVGLVLLKVCSLIAFLYCLHDVEPVPGVLALLGLCVIYVWVVVNNFRVLLALKERK